MCLLYCQVDLLTVAHTTPLSQILVMILVSDSSIQRHRWTKSLHCWVWYSLVELNSPMGQDAVVLCATGFVLSSLTYAYVNHAIDLTEFNKNQSAKASLTCAVCVLWYFLKHTMAIHSSGNWLCNISWKSICKTFLNVYSMCLTLLFEPNGSYSFIKQLALLYSMQNIPYYVQYVPLGTEPKEAIHLSDQLFICLTAMTQGAPLSNQRLAYWVTGYNYKLAGIPVRLWCALLKGVRLQRVYTEPNIYFYRFWKVIINLQSASQLVWSD